MKLLRLTSLCCLLALPLLAFADVEFEASSSKLSYHKIKVGGYLYGSYNYLVRSPVFISDFYDRGNDIAQDGVRLQQAYLAVSSFDNGLGGLLVTMLGQDAYYQTPYGFNPNVFGSSTVGFAIPEAYLQYRAEDYTIKVGLITALAGYEAYDYRQVDNFSRSLQDQFSVPGAHTSIRVIRRMTNEVGLIAGLCNGWSTIVNPLNLTSIELGVDFTRDDIIHLMMSGFLGKSYLVDNGNHGPQGMRKLIEAYGDINVTKFTDVAVVVDYATQTKAELPYQVINQATWTSVASYFNYHWTEKFTTSLRGEIFRDADGYRTGVRQCLKEATVTFSYHPVKRLTITAETRHDFSNKNSYQYMSGSGVNSNQQSYSLSAMFQFV